MGSVDAQEQAALIPQVRTGLVEITAYDKTIHIKTVFTAIIFTEFTCQHKSTLCSFCPGNSEKGSLVYLIILGKGLSVKKITKRIITLLLVF